MKRNLLALALGLALPCLLIGTADAVPFGVAKVGAGVYGISNTRLSIQNLDAESSGMFGIRGRVKVLSLLSFEPSWTRFASSDVTPGINTFTLGFTTGSLIYAAGGIGWSRVNVTGIGSSTYNTYMFGGGAEVSAGPVSLDVSPRIFVVNNPGENIKNVAVMAGVNYYFF